MKISHIPLSKAQRAFLKSQKSNITNKSENLKRIEEKVQGSFEMFEQILKSNQVDQDYKDKLFPRSKISEFLKYLTYYAHSSNELEQNKLEIVNEMIKLGLLYYRLRFKKTRILRTKIGEFQDFISMLQEFTAEDIQEKESTIKKKSKSNSRV